MSTASRNTMQALDELIARPERPRSLFEARSSITILPRSRTGSSCHYSGEMTCLGGGHHANVLFMLTTAMRLLRHSGASHARGH